MPTYEVDVGGKTYEVDAPDPNTAWQWANFTYQSTAKTQAKPIVSDSAGFSLGDIAKSFGMGAAGSTKALTDIAGAGNFVSSKLEGATESLQKSLTPERQAEMERQAARMKAAEESGSILQEIKAGALNVAEAPLQSAAQAIGSFVPYLPAMLASPIAAAMRLTAGSKAAIATVAQQAPKVIGTAQGAGAVKGSIYDGVLQAEIEAGVDPETAKKKAEAAQSYFGGNFDQIALGGGLGFAAGSSGVEKFLTPAGRAGAAQGVGRRVGEAVIKESFPEAAQGGQERLAQNIALQREGYDVDTFKGVAGAATQEALTGALGAAPIAALSRPDPTIAAKKEEDKFKQEEEEFRKQFGKATPVDIKAPEAPTEFPGGYTATRRELSRQDVPESFGIFAEGSPNPLTTVQTQEEAQAKLQTLSEIRAEEQARLVSESDTISKGILGEQRKLEVMEATGQTDTDQYVQSKAALLQKEEEAAQKIKDLNDRIVSYSSPLSFAPIGTRTDVQSDYVVKRGDQEIGAFPTLQDAELKLREIEPEPFKQAEQEARVKTDDRVTQLKQTLTPMLEKFGLRDVGLNVVDRIENNAGGRYLDSLIDISLTEQNPVQTLRHEALHALKDLQFFTPQQYKVLEERANKQWIKEYLQDQTAEIEVNGKPVQMSRLDAYKRLGYSQEAIVEEAIADAFGAYARGATPPPGMIAALFKKLQNFFLNFGQALRGAGFESADDVFQRVERGELKSRKPKVEKTTPEVKQPKEAALSSETKEKPKYSLAGEGTPMSTRSLMERQDAVSQQDLGLNTEPGRTGTNNVRDIAKALNQQTLDQIGAMDRNNLTQDESTRIAEAIADEVAYQLQTSTKTGTGLGWYSNNYPNAVKRLAKRFPELGTNKHARSVFSALVAVTSNGERVAKNIDNAIKLYAKLRNGKRLVAMGNRRPTALQNNLKVIQDLLAKHGQDFERVLLKEITVKEMNARLREMGEETDGSYLANTVVPAAAVYFGPKLGAFYANLSGSEGYLTMDLWWTRSINRMRGLLIPKATEASITKFRDMMESPGATRDEVIAATIPLRNKYEEYDWNSELEHLVKAKEPAKNAAKPAWFKKAEEAAGDAYEQLLFEHNLEKMANTIYKNEFEMLEEAPFTGSDRKFMYDAARKAQALLRNDGINLSLADIQAALWYYEKRLYAKLSGRKADDIGYEEAIIAQANQGSGRARPSVVFDQKPDSRDERGSEVAVSDEASGLDGEKFSLRKGVVAEVAPNPDHISAKKWREMTPSERLNATKAVANRVVSSVFSELDLKGYKYEFSTGTYEGEVNPNIIVQAPDEATEQELDELARVLGYVLDQKAMVAFDEDNKSSGDQAGFVKVVIPTGMSASDLNELRQHISQSVPQADGDTLRDGALLYGNFSAYNDNVDTLTDKQYHKAILDAVESFPYDGVIRVSDPETFHSAFIWPDTRSDYLKETRYGDSGKIQGEAGADVRGQGSRRLQAISETAITLRDKWIDARGASRLGGRERGAATDFGQPTEDYGTPTRESVSVIGVHFSKERRSTLISDFHGTGLRGLEGERLNEKENSDIRSRIYFYVDNGKGVRPEAGVGGTPHVIRLRNLYDASADPLDIIKKTKGDNSADRASKWERSVKKAGFDGYLVKNQAASQDYAVLVGKHSVDTGKLSLRTVSSPAFKQWFGDSKIVNADGTPKVMYHGLAKDTTDFTRKTERGAPIFLTDDPKFADRFAADSFEAVARHPEKYLSKNQIADGVKRAIAAIRKDYGKDSFGKLMLESLQTGNIQDAIPEAQEYIQKELMGVLPTGPHIMPLYVRAERPFDYENPSHTQQVMKIMSEEGTLKGRTPAMFKRGSWEDIEHREVQSAIKALGFDSFYVMEDGRKNLAVYEPNQVKSATGNTGQYSRTDNDVRYSLKNVAFPSAEEAKKAVAKTSVPKTDEFKRFIAGNQWIDEDGDPKVFYHATAREFFEFDPDLRVVYLSDTPEAAEPFGKIAEDRLRQEIYRALNKQEKLDFFQRVVDDAVKADKMSKAEASTFMRKADRKIPEYGNFGDIESEVLEALIDLSPTRMSIMPLYARAETPFDFEDKEQVARVMNWVRQNVESKSEFADQKFNALQGSIVQGTPQAIEQEGVQRALRRLGFDGYTVRKRGQQKSYAVYTSEQVKSVTGNLGEYSRESKDVRYSLRSFNKEDLPQKGRDYTLPQDTLLYHGAYKERADRIEEMGSVLLSRPPMRVSGGAIDEGGLIFFGDEDTARKFAENRADPMAVEGARQAGVERLTGKVFETATDRPYKLINRNYKMNAKEAKALTEALGLPEYKALDAGDPLGIATGRALDYGRSTIDRYEVTTRTGQRKETISAPWPVIFRTLGVDGFYDSLGVALTADNGIKLVGKDGKLEKYSLPTIPQKIQDRMGETTTRAQRKTVIQSIVEAITPTSAADFRAKALNRYNQMSVNDKKLAEQRGGIALLADESAESAALMSDLGAGVAASAMGFDDRNGGIPVLRNGITTIDKRVKGLIASLAPLAQHGDPAVYQRYQYWAMVKRGQRLNANGTLTGIDTADVAFAKVLEQAHPEFVSVQKDLIAFNNGVVQYMVDTGVLSQERGNMYTKYADYIPFYRQMDGDETLGPNLFQSLSGVKPPKKLKGAVAAEAPIADFLETMVRNTQSSIQAGIKNYAAQRAINVAVQVKAPGMGAERLNFKSDAPDVINVLEKGNLVSYRTPDTLLVNAMMSLNQSELPFMGFLSAPADMLRNLVTKEPGFMMANMLRDSLSAWVTSGVKMTPIAGTVINFGKAIARTSPGFEALLDAGIIGGYEFNENIEKSGFKLEKDLATKAGQKAPLVLRPFKSVWDALGKGTTASDAATRALIYERVLAETGNEAEALYRALEVMNFHRKGSSPLIRVLTAAVPFFNARLQGLDVFYRASFGRMNNKDAAAIQRQFFVRGFTMMALSGLYWMLVSDDEEYKKQEQETKDNNWIIPAIGAKIPIPFEVGVLFKVIPERIMAYSFGNDTGEDLKKSMIRSAVSTFAFNPIPQTVKPVLEAYVDYNMFTMRPILGQGMKDIEPEYQVGPSTSNFAIALAQNLGLSPIKVDHIIKGYTGTIGMYAIDTIDMVMDQFGDSPKPTKRFEQLPIIKRFAADPEARGYVTQYYELKDAVDTTVRTMNLLEKTNQPEEYIEYVLKNQGSLAFKDYISDTEKSMKELREMKIAIRSSSMDGDEKRDALLAISQMESALTSNIQEIKKTIASVQ